MSSWVEYNCELSLAAIGESDGMVFGYPGANLTAYVHLEVVEGARLRRARLTMGYRAMGSGSPETHEFFRAILHTGPIEPETVIGREYTWTLPDLAPMSYEGVYVKIEWALRLELYGVGGELETETLPFLVRPRPVDWVPFTPEASGISEDSQVISASDRETVVIAAEEARDAGVRIASRVAENDAIEDANKDASMQVPESIGDKEGAPKLADFRADGGDEEQIFVTTEDEEEAKKDAAQAVAVAAAHGPKAELVGESTGAVAVRETAKGGDHDPAEPRDGPASAERVADAQSENESSVQKPREGADTGAGDESRATDSEAQGQEVDEEEEEERAKREANPGGSLVDQPSELAPLSGEADASTSETPRHETTTQGVGEASEGTQPESPARAEHAQVASAIQEHTATAETDGDDSSPDGDPDADQSEDESLSFEGEQIFGEAVMELTGEFDASEISEAEKGSAKAPDIPRAEVKVIPQSGPKVGASGPAVARVVASTVALRVSDLREGSTSPPSRPTSPEAETGRREGRAVRENGEGDGSKAKEGLGAATLRSGNRPSTTEQGSDQLGTPGARTLTGSAVAPPGADEDSQGEEEELAFRVADPSAEDGEEFEP